MKEIRCLDLSYLMEQRFRYTRIRDELEMPHLVSELRRKCEKCLKISEGEQGNNSDASKSGKDSDMSNQDGSETEAKESESETENRPKYDSKLKKTDSKKTDQILSKSQRKKKKRRKKKKKSDYKDLKVLKRFWFKRDPSPPPQDELEQHLHELRLRTRKEIHTLLYFNNTAQETKIKQMKRCAALLSKKAEEQWNKQIEMLDKEFDMLAEEPTEYNDDNLMERLKENPELLEAIDRLKAEQPLSQTIIENSYQIATRMERQLFSLIPGVSGLTVYRNMMICELARDEINTMTV
uniref:Uncharacterized protein n=1 Tax=Elaeophora elaphi TaxID=1147741 RepID=A0A0R3S1Z1_9BILA